MTSILPPGLMPQNSGIASLLNPIIRVVSQDYKQDVVDPYIQQVEQLTTTTFPNVQFGSPLPVGGGMFPPGFDPSHVINPLKNPFDGTRPVGQGGEGLGTYGPIGTLRGTTVMGNPFATDPIRPFNPTNIPPELTGQGAGIMGTLGLVR